MGSTGATGGKTVGGGALGIGCELGCSAVCGWLGVWRARLRAAATATPLAFRLTLTGLCRPKSWHPRLVNDALSRAAMNVNRLFPVAGTGEGLLLNRSVLATMNAACRLIMLAQKLAGVSACWPPARESPNGSSLAPVSRGRPRPAPPRVGSG